jgi:methylated-DNA-[protein]-cysteine S-methyltransferase
VAADLMEPLRSCVVPTPLGNLALAVSSRGVLETAFAAPGEDDREVIARMEERRGMPMRPAPRALGALAREIEGYFEGRLHAFTTPPDLSPLPQGFGRRVLEVTARIPFGELWTYGDVAAMAGSPRAGRAAGGALSRCPIELFVPCHRVVHAGGSLGGYGRHEERKRWLIAHEREPDARVRRKRG